MPDANAVLTIDPKEVAARARSVAGALNSEYGFPAFPSPRLLEPLKLPYWRTESREAAYVKWAAEQGIRQNVLLSSLWCRYSGVAPRGQCLALSGNDSYVPHAHLAQFETFVREQVRASVSSGTKVAYWEPLNEPLSAGYWGRYANSRDAFALFQRAYSSIRAEDANAWIGGPSLAEFNLSHIETFLQASSDAGLKIDFLAWHELHDCPQEIPAHVEAVRSLVKENFSHLGIKELHINEYGSETRSDSPALNLAHLAALEQADVDVGAKSCWGALDCNVLLGGLLTSSIPDQDLEAKVDACRVDPACDIARAFSGIELLPSNLYWLYQRYGESIGGSRLAVVRSGLAVPAVARTDPTGDRIVIAGYAAPTGSPEVRVAVRIGPGLSAHEVDVERIGATRQASAAPARVEPEAIVQDCDVLHLALPPLQNHEVFVIRFTPRK